MTLYFIAYSGLINALASFILGFLALFKNYNSRINRGFAYFAFAVGSWALFYFFWILAKEPYFALIFIRCAMVGAILIPVAYTYFTSHLLGQQNYKLHLLNIALAGVFICFAFSPIYISKVESRLFFPNWPVPGYLFHLMLLHFVSNVIYAHINLGRAIRTLRGIKRMQVKYVFYGTLIGFIGGCTNYFLWYKIPIPPYLNLLVSVYVICVAYAIVQYRLMDIRVAFIRIAILVIVYTLILSISFGFGYSAFGRWGLWAIVVLVAIILASIGPFLYLFLQRKTENRFLREQREIQETLIRVFKHITKVRKLDKLVKLIAKLLTMVLKVEHSAVFLLDAQTHQYRIAGSKGKLPYFPETILPPDSLLIKHIQTHRDPLVYEELKLKSDERNATEIKEVVFLMRNISAQVIVPSFIGDTLLGFAILGNKTSGEIYTQQDLLTLSIISERFSVAIEYAQFLKEFEAFQAKLREAEKLKGVAQMMHSLNHEFRNLFNNMLMAIAFLLSTDDKEVIPKTLTGIEDNVTKGVEILEAVQSYNAKSKSDEIKLRKVETVLNDSLTGFQEKFQKANIQYTFNIPPNLPEIQTRDTFEDLFPNIFANSYLCFIELPENHEKLIDIKITFLADKKTLQIKISDTGRDITKSAYQSDKDTLFKERGRLGGVNLYLAYLTVNDHKGILKLESYEKGGTVFIIEIPTTQQESIA